jgi:hypothetical protein
MRKFSDGELTATLVKFYVDNVKTAAISFDLFCPHFLSSGIARQFRIQRSITSSYLLTCWHYLKYNEWFFLVKIDFAISTKNVFAQQPDVDADLPTTARPFEMEQSCAL